MLRAGGAVGGVWIKSGVEPSAKPICQHKGFGRPTRTHNDRLNAYPLGRWCVKPNRIYLNSEKFANMKPKSVKTVNRKPGQNLKTEKTLKPETCLTSLRPQHQRLRERP